MIIGISGKIGSGKSHVTKFLKKRLKFSTISEDKLVNQLLNEDSVKSELVSQFGPRILNPNKRINKDVLQKKYSRNDDFLKLYYKIIIPAVSKEIQKLLQENEDNYIIDISSPEKYRLSNFFDVSVLVTAPKSLSFKRSKLKVPYRNFSTIWNWQKDTKKYDFLIENKTSIKDLKKDIEQLIVEMFSTQPKS